MIHKPWLHDSSGGFEQGVDPQLGRGPSQRITDDVVEIGQGAVDQIEQVGEARGLDQHVAIPDVHATTVT